MASDDFCSIITLDTLSSGIPRCYDAIRIKLEDCVINDGINQQAVPTFALEQLLIGRAPVRDVTRNFGEADQLVLRILDRNYNYAGPKTTAILANAPPFRKILSSPCSCRQCSLGQT